MVAEIICVGTELLLGDIVNTNAAFLSRRLSESGIDIYFQTVVGDNSERLKNIITEALKRADILIFTGGLGPTADDLTKEVVASLLGLELVMHEKSLQTIENIFKNSGRTMTENNKKQAMVPVGSTVLENENGTAPGILIEKDAKTFILLPGPPKEMEPMLTNKVMPLILNKTEDIIVSKRIRIFGMGESAVENIVSDLMETTNPTLAPYAKEGEVELRVTAKAKSESEAFSLINPVAEIIGQRLHDYIYGFDSDTLPLVLINKLKEKDLSISLAESCTGGLLGDMLTEISGASEVFFGGVISYSNEMKKNLLNVSEKTLNVHGAVSPETAMEMAKGIKEKTGAFIGVSITGIAGPGGGSPEKPVGLVYIGLAFGEKLVFKKLSLFGNRQKIRKLSAMNAVNFVIKECLN